MKVAHNDSNLGRIEQGCISENLEVLGISSVDVQVRNDGRSSVERLNTGETSLNREGNSSDRDISGVGGCDD